MRAQGYHVPTERFFVRNHTSTPRVDPLTYSLELFGRGVPLAEVLERAGMRPEAVDVMPAGLDVVPVT